MGIFVENQAEQAWNVRAACLKCTKWPDDHQAPELIPLRPPTAQDWSNSQRETRRGTDIRRAETVGLHIPNPVLETEG